MKYEYTDGKRIEPRTFWIEELMMNFCCTRTRATNIFKNLVANGYLWKIAV